MPQPQGTSFTDVLPELDAGIFSDKTNRGDILKLVGAGAPGFGKLGDLVRVLDRTKLGVMVENKHGEKCEFVYNCGAARLEPTEWKNDFPEAEAQAA